MSNFFKGLKSKKYVTILVIALALCLMSGIFASVIQSDGGKIDVQDHRLVIGSNPSVVQSFIIYKPKTATETNKAPVIIASHGYLNSREMQDINAIEWARRGYVVIAVDMNGHGNSNVPSISDSTNGFRNYIDYASKLPYADATKIGVSGHSMGGSSLNAASLYFTNQENAAIDKVLGVNTALTGAALTKDRTDKAAAASAEKLAEAVKARDIAQKIAVALPIASDIQPGLSGLPYPYSTSTYYGARTSVGTIAPEYDEFFYKQEGKYTGTNAAIPSTKEIAGVIRANPDKSNAYKYEWLPKDYLASPRAGDIVRQVYPTFSVTERLTVPAGEGLVVPANNPKIYIPNAAVENGGIYTANGLVNSNSLANGKAVGEPFRALFTTYEIHPWAHFSTASSNASINFWYAAFGIPDGAKFLAPTNQTWWIKEAVNLVGLVGWFMMLIPLVVLLLKVDLFKSLVKAPVAVESLPELKGKKRVIPYWIIAVFSTLFAGFTMRFFMLSNWGFGNAIFPTTPAYPQVYPNQIAVWAIACGLLAIGLSAINYYAFGKKLGDRPYDVAKISLVDFGKSALLATIVVTCMYVVLFVVQALFTADFRIWSFAAKTFEPLKIATIFRYSVIFLAYYAINAYVNVNGRFKNLKEWQSTALSALFSVLGIAIVFAIQYGVFFTTGNMWQGDAKLVYIVLFTIIPTLVLAAYFARRIYLKTGNIWLGAMINAFVFTALMVANTSTAMPYIFG